MYIYITYKIKGMVLQMIDDMSAVDENLKK